MTHGGGGGGASLGGGGGGGGPDAAAPAGPGLRAVKQMQSYCIVYMERTLRT